MIPEKEPSDAPCYLSSSEASAWASGFNAARDLFAPILAEKEREIERLQAGWDKARTSAKYWGGLYSDLDDKTRGSEARALAAEAALAAERERCAKVIEYRIERLRGNRKRIAQVDQHVISIMESLAAAIRAQGPG